MTKRFCFVYRTTNLANGKYYIGCHCTFKLDDGYLGSGMRIQRSIAKYGRKNFKLEILEYFESRQEALLREKELVTEELLKDPMCMNLRVGGEGGFNLDVAIRGARARAKKVWSDPEFRKRHSAITIVRNRKLHRLGKLKSPPPCCERGYRHSDETKKRMSRSHSGSRNSQHGKVWIHSLDERRSIRINESESSKYLDLGWLLGRKMKW